MKTMKTDVLLNPETLSPEAALPSMPPDLATLTRTARAIVGGVAGLGEAKPATKRRLLRDRAFKLAAEIRNLEGEALRHFMPLPHVASFFESRKAVRILVGSNQSSKTIHAALAMALAVTGQHPGDGYPKENGRALIVGYDGDHLADPCYKKLFVEGEFKLIPDERTGKLRAVRPDLNDSTQLDPYDKAYSEKWVDAPPLIPERFVADHAWEHANKEIPRVTKLRNDWRILWRSSNSRPPRGRQLHIAWFDEDLARAGAWVNELIPRLLKHDGKLIWAATGQEGGPELVELVTKAEEGCQYIDVWNLLITQNPFISDEQRQFFRETLTSDEEVNVRYHGEIATASRMVYREYKPNGIHGYEPFEIPLDWARYILFDPSRQHAGTLFVAVDPEEKHVWVYDGFDLQQAGGLPWAAAVKNRMGAMQFEAAVIDEHMGRMRHVGGFNDLTVAAHYWQALEDLGVQFRTAGPRSGFFPGLDDIEARTLALKKLMMPRGSGPFAGTPRLQVARGVIPALDKQISRAQTEPGKGQKRSDKYPQDLLDALEYGAAFELGYHPPEPVTVNGLGPPPEVLAVGEQFRAKHRYYAARRAARGEVSGRQFGAAMEIGG
jgi:hypothetical protein